MHCDNNSGIALGCTLGGILADTRHLLWNMVNNNCNHCMILLLYTVVLLRVIAMYMF